MEDCINAWEIILLVNGKQQSDTQYVAVDETDGWVGGLDILQETVSAIVADAFKEYYYNINVQVQIVQINPADVFI